MREVGAVFGGLVLIGAIVFGGWQLGWWFRTQDTNREAVVYGQSYGVQTSVGDALSRQITDISKIDAQIADPGVDSNQAQMLRAQRQHEVDDACALFARLTTPNPSFSTWATAHCATAGI